MSLEDRARNHAIQQEMAEAQARATKAKADNELTAIERAELAKNEKEAARSEVEGREFVALAKRYGVAPQFMQTYRWEGLGTSHGPSRIPGELVQVWVIEAQYYDYRWLAVSATGEGFWCTDPYRGGSLEELNDGNDIGHYKYKKVLKGHKVVIPSILYIKAAAKIISASD